MHARVCVTKSNPGTRQTMTKNRPGLVKIPSPAEHGGKSLRFAMPICFICLVFAMPRLRGCPSLHMALPASMLVYKLYPLFACIQTIRSVLAVLGRTASGMACGQKCRGTRSSGSGWPTQKPVCMCHVGNPCGTMGNSPC
jgi:hypothetical protein